MSTYRYTGAPVFVTVSTTGDYDIVAFGAQGGNSRFASGGYGAEIGGTVHLTAGEKLEIVVGSQGGYGGPNANFEGNSGGGGGGGSFVLANIGGVYQPLVIAGGGGGASTTVGGAGRTTKGTGTAITGQGGAAGSGSMVYTGAGGSGFKSNGHDGTEGGPEARNTGGSNRTGGYAGGKNSLESDVSPYSYGGFGGGGAGASLYGGGGGGGGYSGGAGGTGSNGFGPLNNSGGGGGGGGGSYDAGIPIASQTIAGANDGNGRIIFAPDAVTCFVTGTRIRTARGEVAVEGLRVGDHVVTASGAARPIRWIGHRTIDCRSHPRPGEAMPVCIHAHAFAAGRPGRDLLVSPGHAICADLLGEMLIPAGALVNGTTVQQVEVAQVTYWHVELDSHDILLAENLPVESYLDMGNRAFFVEAGVIALAATPDGMCGTHADFCRPFHAGGPLVDAVRARLAQPGEASRIRRASWVAAVACGSRPDARSCD